MTETRGTSPSLADVVARSRVVVCAGSGGTGKTTTAAALAIAGARVGRRAVVVTIDPARRLADAMGLDRLTNQPSEIVGPWQPAGSLHAMMLDTKSTFDELVLRYANDDAQRQRILENRFYRNVSNALSGTQEYMATEKLFELYQSPEFDLVVVDTPPSRNALDFLDAPDYLARMLDHRVYRVLTSQGSGVTRIVNRTAQRIIRVAARVAGAQAIDDAVAFFAAFEGLEAGFRSRSAQVKALLSSPETAFVVVASPRPEPALEAEHLAERLSAARHGPAGLVINRCLPDFATAVRPETPARGVGEAGPLAALWANLTDYTALADREIHTIQHLTGLVSPAPVVRIPMFDREVTDLEELGEIASLLASGASGS